MKILLASALGALSGVLLILYLLDRLPLGPHAVRCDGGEGTPPPDEPVEFDTRMSNEEWVNAVITEALRKANR